MTYRDFDNMLNVGRPTFTAGGQTFTARAKLPWRKFSNLILSLSQDTSSEEGITKTEDFFRLVLVSKDRDRFIALLNYDGDEDEDDDKVVSPSQVAGILDWLLAYYTGKQETSENPSSDLPLDTGPGVNGHSEVQTVSLNPKV